MVVLLVIKIMVGKEGKTEREILSSTTYTNTFTVKFSLRQFANNNNRSIIHKIK